MTDFTDVERFAQEHAACGGLTPTAMPRPGGGGYILTLTCACGTSLDRWVSPEEARRPLPIPALTPLSAARAATAEAGAPADPPVPALMPAPSAPEPQAAPFALPGSAAAGRWPRPGGGPRPGPERLSPDTTIASPPRLYVDPTAPPGLPRPSRGRAVWLAILVIAALGGAAVVYLTGATDGLLSPVSSGPPPRSGGPSRAPLEGIVTSLRELHTVATSTTSVSVYSTRVTAAQGEAERYLATSAPGATRTRVREVVDLHLLAVSAWRAKSLDQKEAWEAVGLDPSIELCPPLRLMADFATPEATVSRAQTRGTAVASSLPIVWECAQERIAALEQALAGR